MSSYDVRKGFPHSSSDQLSTKRLLPSHNHMWSEMRLGTGCNYLCTPRITLGLTRKIMFVIAVVVDTVGVERRVLQT